MKKRCRLAIGSTFIFHGNYCRVIRMLPKYFVYISQETNMVCYMDYSFYLKTPSAAGRKLNLWY